MLVTKWDAETDAPIIKLAVFGINAKHQTFCGTEGYVAPEVIKAIKRAEQLRRVMNMVASDRLLMYTNTVDIRALGRTLQTLVLNGPSGTLSQSGKTVPVSKEPALCLIDQMVEENPQRRPTAAKCLKILGWPLVLVLTVCWPKKRERSPSNLASSPVQTPQKSGRRAIEDNVSKRTSQAPPTTFREMIN